MRVKLDQILKYGWTWNTIFLKPAPCFWLGRIKLPRLLGRVRFVWPRHGWKKHQIANDPNSYHEGVGDWSEGMYWMETLCILEVFFSLFIYHLYIIYIYTIYNIYIYISNVFDVFQTYFMISYPYFIIFSLLPTNIWCFTFLNLHIISWYFDIFWYLTNLPVEPETDFWCI